MYLDFGVSSSGPDEISPLRVIGPASTPHTSQRITVSYSRRQVMGNNGSKTGKCATCSQNKCERKYKNRDKCEDPVNCSCTCQEDTNVTFWKGFGSVVGGVAAFAGGVALTVTTGGLGAVGIVAVIGGGALTGAGASMAIQPVAKKMSGEQMTGVADYFKDVAIGGTIGAVTGPIGLGGTSVTTAIASKVGTEVGKQGAVKFFCRTVVGAVSGAASSAIQEGAEATSRKASGKKAFANVKSSLINIGKGAALGAVTGGAAHLSGNVVNKVAETGVARSVTKVAADTVSTAVIDASYQGIVDGEVDLKKLALNVGVRAATSAGSEAVTNATYKVHGGKDVLRDKLGDKQILDQLDPKEQENLIQAKKFIQHELTADEARKQVLKAFLFPSAELDALKTEREIIKERTTNTYWNEVLIKTEKEYFPVETNEKIEIQKQINKNKLENLSKVKPDKLGDQKVHALRSEHIGQFAADLSANDGIKKQVVFDVTNTKEGALQAKIVGVAIDKDYSKVPIYEEAQAPKLKVNKPFVLPMATDKAAGGSANQVAVAQQLVDDLHAGKISWNEYTQKWNTMKPKDVPVKVNADQLRTHYANGNIPKSQYNKGMQEMSKNGSGKTTVVLNASLKSGPTSTSGSQQPPQQPTENNRPEDLDNRERVIRELRQRLKKLLEEIRERIRQDTGRELSEAERQFQRETFHEIFTIVSELISNGHSVAFDGPFESLVISSRDGSWSEVIEYQLADYLDVHDQLIDQQFDLAALPDDRRANAVPCPTILSAQFEGSRLVLSERGDHGGATNVIYGIRCRLCDRRLGPGNINYVGQTIRSVHQRVCIEHAGATANAINGSHSGDASHRPMYQHVAQHIQRRFLFSWTANPRDAFRQVMDVILLPIGPIESEDDLRSWEVFWQFFFHCREFFWGWSKR